MPTNRKEYMKEYHKKDYLKNKINIINKVLKWQKENKQKTNFKNRQYALRLKRTVYDYYGWECNCCGETITQFLTIDHVNNDGYKDKYLGKYKRSGVNLYLKIISSNFSGEYQILCMNCNHGKRMNNGICPHTIL